MNAELLERQAILAGVALLSVLGSLALGRNDAPPPPEAAALPAPPVAGRWLEAAVGVYGPGFYGGTTACGVELARGTVGVNHPVLPCRARVVVAHAGRVIEARVIDRRPDRSGQEFALTQALADELGVRGVEIVRWRVASRDR